MINQISFRASFRNRDGMLRSGNTGKTRPAHDQYYFDNSAGGYIRITGKSIRFYWERQ